MVRPAWVTTRWCKTTTRSAEGSVSRKQVTLGSAFFLFKANYMDIKSFLKKAKFYLIFLWKQSLYYEGQKRTLLTLRTLKSEYSNYQLHKADLAATHGATAGASCSLTRWCCLMYNGAPPETREVAWNPYLKRRVSDNDTHRCDTLKESAVLPYFGQEAGAVPAAGLMICPYIKRPN